MTVKTNILTGEVRASYVNVFRPRMNDLSGKEEYSMQIIIDKGDAKTVGRVKEAIKNAITKKWGDKPPRGLRNPLRDPEAEAEEEGTKCAPHLVGKYFMNVKNGERPGVVDRDKMEIIDPSEFQSGDYCRCSLNASAYDAKGNKGVSFWLQNIQFLRKGDPLGNKTRAEDDFEDDDDLEEADWAA